MRAFVAFNMGQDDTDRIFGLVEAKLQALPAQAINSIHYHRQTFHDAGGWDGWINQIVTGQSYLTRQPNFDFMVCTQKTLGRATAQLVEKFIDVGKPVLFFDENDGFREVHSIQTDDSENWQSGWQILC